MAASPIYRFASFKQILPQCLTELGIAERVHLEQIYALWPQIVGDKISGYTQIMEYSKGKLTVQINEPGWKEALEAQTVKIIRKFNTKLATSAVQQVSFYYHPSVKPTKKPG